MNRRDELIIKLAALQVKHYGTFDPEFIKEAVHDIGVLSGGREGYNILEDDPLVKYFRTYVEQMQKDQLIKQPSITDTYSQAQTTTKDMLKTLPQGQGIISSNNYQSYNPNVKVSPELQKTMGTALKHQFGEASVQEMAQEGSKQIPQYMKPEAGASQISETHNHLNYANMGLAGGAIGATILAALLAKKKAKNKTTR
jgi:hypothetical protein